MSVYTNTIFQVEYLKRELNWQQFLYSKITMKEYMFGKI